MRRLATTVLTVVGAEAQACLGWFAAAGNVAAIDPGDSASATDLATAQETWSAVARSRSRFTMHRADPLGVVGAAWADEFDGGARGRLDVAITDTLARWRTDTIGLPDYYIVLDPEALSAAEKHFYLGILHRAAPHRVVPVDADGAAVSLAIGRLAAGRWWPALDELVGSLPDELPNAPMLAS